MVSILWQHRVVIWVPCWSLVTGFFVRLKSMAVVPHEAPPAGPARQISIELWDLVTFIAHFERRAAQWHKGFILPNWIALGMGLDPRPQVLAQHVP